MTITSVVLPRLQISTEDVASLRALSTSLQNEVVAQYEDFITRRRRRVDRTKWRFVRSYGAAGGGEMHIHQELDASTDALGFMSTSRTKHAAHEPQTSLASDTNCPRVLVTGTKPGSLDDAMYGCSFSDTASLRTHDAYQHSVMDDTAVLCRIDGPTPADPYQILGLVWHLRTSRLGKDRDYLLLQHVHLAQLSTGERIGIHIRHSVTHRDLPEFGHFSTRRVAMSAVSIFRQHDQNHLEFFGVGFDDEKRRGPDLVQLQGVTRDLLASASECDSGFKRKLHWFLRKRHSQKRQSEYDRSSTSSTRDHARPHRQDCCELCAKPTGRLFSASGAFCQLCTKYVCSRCVVTHEIIVDASSAGAIAKPFGFCIECIIYSTTVSTFHIAREDIVGCDLGSDKVRWSAASSRSTVASSRGSDWKAFLEWDCC